MVAARPPHVAPAAAAFTTPTGLARQSPAVKIAATPTFDEDELFCPNLLAMAASSFLVCECTRQRHVLDRDVRSGSEHVVICVDACAAGAQRRGHDEQEQPSRRDPYPTRSVDGWRRRGDFGAAARPAKPGGCRTEHERRRHTRGHAS